MIAPNLLANRYRLGDLLGRGGMGDVFDGWDIRLDRAVAIKLLSPHLASQSGIRTRFRQESRSAAGLHHANIVAVFDSGEQDGIPFFVMERLPGRTFADEMASGPLPADRVRSVLADVLEALEFAHRTGVIHRDVKPANILLTESGTAKLADFGIAKSAHSNLTQTGQLLGTVSYLSPERLEGAPASPQSDLYSAGIVGYEALWGEKPFKAETPLALVREVAGSTLPAVKSRRPDVDDELAAAIDRAARRLPQERFRSAADMLAAIDPSRASRSLHAPAPAPIGSPRPAGEEQTAAERPGGMPTRVEHPHTPRALSTGRPGSLWAFLAAAGLLVILLLLRLNPPGDRTTGQAAGPSSAPAGSVTPSAPVAGGSTASTRAVRGITSLEFLGPGRLQIQQGDSESLLIEGPDEAISSAVSEMAGGKLTIGAPSGAPIPGGAGIVYRLTVKSLSGISNVGNGSIDVSGLFVPALKVAGLGAGGMVMRGTADDLTVVLQGSGSYDGSALRSRRAVVMVSGSGSAVVSVSDRLDARVNGSGSIQYTGDPTVTRQVAGSGSVRKAG